MAFFLTIITNAAQSNKY